MDEYFKVGADRLMYPRDPGGSAGEIINCNCVMVTVRRKGTKGSRDRGIQGEWLLVNAISFGDGSAESARRRAA